MITGSLDCAPITLTASTGETAELTHPEFDEVVRRLACKRAERDDRCRIAIANVFGLPATTTLGHLANRVASLHAGYRGCRVDADSRTEELASALGIEMFTPWPKLVERAAEFRGSSDRIRADIPHVWDVDGKPRGVRHELVLDGETLTVRDATIENGLIVADHAREMSLTTAVHVLLNATAGQLEQLEANVGGDQAEWTDVWPTEPGWYWTSLGTSLEPTQVSMRGDQLRYTRKGMFVNAVVWSGLKWGPEITLPLPP